MFEDWLGTTTPFVDVCRYRHLTLTTPGDSLSLPTNVQVRAGLPLNPASVGSVFVVTDFFADPDFPDRPQHPDFHRLMEAVNYLDGETTEGGRDAFEVASEVIDVESLVYMAVQRARRVSGVTGLPEVPLASLYLDAFVTGVRVQQHGGHREG